MPVLKTGLFFSIFSGLALQHPAPSIPKYFRNASQSGSFCRDFFAGTFLPGRPSFAVHVILDFIPDIVGLQAKSPDRHSGKPVFFHNIQLGFHRLFVLTPDLVEF